MRSASGSPGESQHPQKILIHAHIDKINADLLAFLTCAATEIGRINKMISEVETLATPLTRQMNASAKSFRWSSSAWRAKISFGDGCDNNLRDACSVAPIKVRPVVGDPFRPPLAETQDDKTQDTS